MRRYFNESLVGDEGAIVSVPVPGKNPVVLPVVKGVLGVPEDLAPHIALTAEWKPFAGQVSDVSDESLTPLTPAGRRGR